jgi:hypothetical protein
MEWKAYKWRDVRLDVSTYSDGIVLATLNIEGEEYDIHFLRRNAGPLCDYVLRNFGIEELRQFIGICAYLYEAYEFPNPIDFRQDWDAPVLYDKVIQYYKRIVQLCAVYSARTLVGVLIGRLKLEKIKPVKIELRSPVKYVRISVLKEKICIETQMNVLSIGQLSCNWGYLLRGQILGNDGPEPQKERDILQRVVEPCLDVDEHPKELGQLKYIIKSARTKEGVEF